MEFLCLRLAEDRLSATPRCHWFILTQVYPHDIEAGLLPMSVSFFLYLEVLG